MQRTTPRIKRDMLEWAKHNLYVRSSDEWSYETLEADPLVHLLVGACASEAKEVYEAIYESDDRLLQRVLQYLLPETFHLPMPAVAIAKAAAKTGICTLSATQHLVYRDSEKALTFAPLFQTNLLGGSIRFIGTDSQVFERSDTPSESNYLIKNERETVSKLLIGIETKQPVTSLDDIAFYVDWKGADLEKRQFLMALSKSQWSCHEQVLKRRNGFLRSKDASWKDHYDAEQTLKQRIDAQYRQHFHLITEPKIPQVAKMEVSDVLRSWLNKNTLEKDESTDTTAKWTSVKGNFLSLIHI